MTSRDKLGRRRATGQSRGLRPLYPRLEAGTASRSLRVAMSLQAWQRLDDAVARSAAPTGARAVGAVLERHLLAADERRGTAWLDWQARKERRLLEARPA